ncbi:MAG: hypothetical protein LQ347_000412 [Umbilicaria vellea]|nr:MAG: hypothetical protein LQ347_000412 [Umbilicaria vellea]
MNEGAEAQAPAPAPAPADSAATPAHAADHPVEDGDGTPGRVDMQENGGTSAQSIKRQRRNKPSLSCEACTTKKTKRQDGGKLSERRNSRSSIGSSPLLLSNVPYSHPTASNVFKAEHPFSNYWTHQGGLPEVIEVLPSKAQADILIAKYFDAVDPVYPMIHRHSFQKDYDYFWSLSPPKRNEVKGDLIALIFVMLAMGTQFVSLSSLDGKEQTAEFYVSASHQALRMSTYLSKPTMRTIQAMVLVTYFLMNDNHASDAWAFAGILIRQAYAMGLNRDPSILTPTLSAFEKQQRRKLWQAVLLQDTFFTVILSLPPTATHTDVKVEDLTDCEIEDAANGASVTEATDISFIRSMWTLANLVQETLCSPRSLSLPIATCPSDRVRIINRFQRIYTSFPHPFRTFTEASICELASRNKRLARQTLFLTSNYFHCLMLVCADENEDLEVDVNGTLEAAHEAINSFFMLHGLFEDEARVWYHFQHRAFSEAHVIAELVKKRPEGSVMDPMRIRAKTDVVRMIGILQLKSGTDIVAKTRVSVLSSYV